MATQSQEQAVGQASIERLIGLARAKQRQFTIAGALLLVVVGGFWFYSTAQERKRSFAARALRDGQSAIAAGNTPLAINDLSRLVSSYAGTPAAGEAALLLGQLRLSRGEVDQAISELRSFLETRPADRYRAAAYGLLGSALEQAGKYGEAAAAYGQAADTWPYPYLQGQALLDAARAFRTAGDTAQAAQSYERILRDFSDSPSALEAELRLAELRKGRVTGSATSAGRGAS